MSFFQLKSKLQSGFRYGGKCNKQKHTFQNIRVGELAVEGAHVECTAVGSEFFLHLGQQILPHILYGVRIPFLFEFVKKCRYVIRGRVLSIGAL